MATVYLARDVGLGRSVALKVLSDQVLRDESSTKRFRKEAQTVAALDHPHIVKVHAVEWFEDVGLLVLEYIPGQSLQQILTRGRQLSVEVVGRWFAQLANALDYAHSRGVVHRDVKPGNILIRESGEAVLTDFGIAKVPANAGLTQAGILVGTPEYMSPERCRGEAATGLTDQYSLGVVLFESLAGMNPFAGPGGELATLHRQLQVEPPRLRDVRHDVPVAMSDAVGRMLSKEPAGRFPALTAAARAATVPEASLVSGEEGQASAERRVPWLKAVLAVVLIGVLAAGGSLVNRRYQNIGSREPGSRVPTSEAADPEQHDLAAAPVDSADESGDAAETPGQASAPVRSTNPPSTPPADVSRGSVHLSAGRILIEGQGDLVVRFDLSAEGNMSPMACAVAEVTRSGGVAQEVGRTGVPVSQGTTVPVEIRTALDQLLPEDALPLAVVNVSGTARVWSGSCTSGPTGDPLTTLPLPSACAQRYPSGVWRECR